MKKVFISFSSKETEKAKTVKGYLEKAGFECWFAPEKILVGDNYLSAIPKAIAESNAFILLISRSSQQSFWVKSELERAINLNIPVFPIQIEECDITEEFRFCLSHIQIFSYDDNLQKPTQQLIQRIGVELPLTTAGEIVTQEVLSDKIRHKRNLAIILGWIGIVLDIIFAIVLFPYTIVQTVVILATLIVFSFGKFNVPCWMVSLLCSIFSLSILNLVSTILLYSDSFSNPSK